VPAGTVTDDATPPLAAGSEPVLIVVAVVAEAVPVAAAGGGLPSWGVAVFEPGDGTLVPAAFVAVTVKVYVMSLVSPVRVARVELPGTVFVTPPGFEVTV
jgi:hypothetical protein